MTFYSYSGLDGDAAIKLVREYRDSSIAGRSRDRVWIPDKSNENFYVVSARGDDEFDAGDASLDVGVCTDFKANYFDSVSCAPHFTQRTQLTTARIPPSRARPWLRFVVRVRDRAVTTREAPRP